MPQLPGLRPLEKILCTPPRCVRCGKNHSSSICTKSNESPACCALCNEDHPANYKGCKTYKELQNHRNFSTKQNNGNKTNNVNFKFNNCESSQRPSQTTNTSPEPSYAQATSAQKSTPPSQNMNNDLTTFINNFQAIINPLIALLTTVLDRLLSNNVK